jgi:hypothetical protein
VGIIVLVVGALVVVGVKVVGSAVVGSTVVGAAVVVVGISVVVVGAGVGVAVVVCTLQSSVMFGDPSPPFNSTIQQYTLFVSYLHFVSPQEYPSYG